MSLHPLFDYIVHFVDYLSNFFVMLHRVLKDLLYFLDPFIIFYLLIIFGLMLNFPGDIRIKICVCSEEKIWCPPSK